MAYRGLLNRKMLTWTFVVMCSRLPVAMAPLAFVFLFRETPGGYARGAFMAAVYTAAEAVGAPFLGSRLRNRPFRREIAAGLLISSAAFGAIAFLPNSSVALFATLTVLAGACSAAAPGALRAMVADLVHEKHVDSALSLESSLNMTVWAVSPALVSFAALEYSVTLPFIVGSASALLSVIAIFFLPEATPKLAKSENSRRASRELASAWPVYLTSAATMYLLATVELSLPALIEQRGYPVSYAGPMLTSFASASILGGILYGFRSWPGGPDRQSIAFLVLMVFLVSAMALSPKISSIFAFLLMAGFIQAIVLIARNLSLRRMLAVDLHSVGYSIVYAGSGIGYGVSAAATGLLLAHSDASSAVLFAAGVTLVLTAITVPPAIRKWYLKPIG